MSFEIDILLHKNDINQNFFLSNLNVIKRHFIVRISKIDKTLKLLYDMNFDEMMKILKEDCERF